MTPWMELMDVRVDRDKRKAHLVRKALELFVTRAELALDRLQVAGLLGNSVRADIEEE